MGPRATRLSPLASRRLLYASCILLGEVHATSTRPFSGGQHRPDSRCRRNGKVLTRKTSWNPRLQDAAAIKVGAVAPNEANSSQTTSKALWLPTIRIFEASLYCYVNCYVNLGFNLLSSQTRTFIPRKHSCVRRIIFFIISHRF